MWSGRRHIMRRPDFGCWLINASVTLKFVANNAPVRRRTFKYSSPTTEIPAAFKLSNSMEVDDDIDPAAHTQMDAAVLGDPSLHHHVQLDLQPDPAHLLALVVLKCKDMAHKIDQSYANMGNARLLTDGNPDVTKLVEDAWSARAFKRIRLL
ncbi:hypothetical protein BDN72DRAFT_862398, partial [Pluteus cervinus]